ncbi:hypothetical protein ACIA8O_36105 [Kitasatospora sp. NPDC051853]|uniref:hypothetical protein n=1 Tax=Kitasatospora sp. NPDC051853 TaxID=3364058 RepID=UPI0037A61EAE
MRRTANRSALALAGLALTAASGTVLLAAAGVLPPDVRPSWLPRTTDSALLPTSLANGLTADRSWDQPVALAVAATGILCLVLLLTQLVSRTPARLRLHAGEPHTSELHTGELRSAALTEAVRARALLVPGVADADVRVGRGRRPALELTARLARRTSPTAAVDPLLAVLAEAAESTGLELRLRLRLTPADSGPRRLS